MTDPAAAMASLTEQAATHLKMQNAVQRSEAQKNTAFKIEMQRLEENRSKENELRKRMDALIADAMAVLKKSGSEIRQAN
jgi:hypothetical protein